jgi:hypothetical protein
MTLSKFKYTVFAIGFLASSAIALEPKEDRAQIQNLFATLLLPDGSYLNTDINFDCGSKFKDTGIIITTDAGARFLSDAYRALYGDKAAEAVLSAWNTKANPEDPRKPTMLLINSFAQDNTTQSNINNSKVNKELPLSSSRVNIKSLDSAEEPKFVPPIMQLCGARVHENYYK